MQLHIKGIGSIAALTMLVTACAGSAAEDPDAGAGVDVAIGRDGGKRVDAGSRRDSGDPTRDAGHSPDVDKPSMDAGLEDTSALDAPSGDAVVPDSRTPDASDAEPDATDAGHDAAEAGHIVIPLVTSPTTLKFGNSGGTAGFVACGTTPHTESFTVSNEGTTLLSWWTEFGAGAGTLYRLSSNCRPTAPCTMAANQKVVVTVTAPAVSATAGVATFDDTVTVFSSAPDDPGSVVSLKEASYGAVLSLSPTSEAFGKQALHGTYSKAVTIKNAGNATYTGRLTVGGTASDDFAEFSTSVASIAVPVPSSTFDVVFKPGASTSAASATVTLGSSDDAICKPLPAPLSVTGQGL